MANLGRVGIVPKGLYSVAAEYKKLDLVTDSGAALTAFKNGTLKGFGMRDRLSSDLDTYYYPMDSTITLEVTTT